MHTNPEIAPLSQRIERVRLAMASHEESFLQNEPYWSAQTKRDPQARYRFHMMRNAIKLIYSMPRKKEPLLSDQVIKKARHIMSLGPAYSCRQKSVMLCNIHMMNAYKLEKQHGANMNKAVYYRLMNTALDHPELDAADVLINNFLRLKRGLLAFDSQDLYLLQWSSKHIADVELGLVRKVMKTMLDDINSKLLALCNQPDHIAQSTLHYMDGLMKEKNKNLKSLSELNQRLVELRSQWHMPK
jgi:hypothetical protein